MAMNDVEDKSRGFELGAVDYISKPVSPPLIRARVRSQLALADQRHGLQFMVEARTS